MKTSKDPRHLERIQVMQELFAMDFYDKQAAHKKTQEIFNNLEKIDSFIRIAAPAWPIEKINKIDLAILRLAIFELLIESKNPPKVTVDEAVELAKDYGSESSGSFVNGALGKLIKENQLL